MWEEIKERLKFFRVIVGALMADAVLVCAWAGIHYLVEYVLAILEVKDSLIINILKYTFEGTTLAVIAFYALGDVIRALKKLIDLIVESFKKKPDDTPPKEDDKANALPPKEDEREDDLPQKATAPLPKEKSLL